mmetsp:Transcript_124427/g.346398  ORF Transcript_124427/g.346398 Transcript_124427/m.346398 type:complete len:95 (+) Transcript_124427:262-546(+)
MWRDAGRSHFTTGHAAPCLLPVDRDFLAEYLPGGHSWVSSGFPDNTGLLGGAAPHAQQRPEQQAPARALMSSGEPWQRSRVRSRQATPSGFGGL